MFMQQRAAAHSYCVRVVTYRQGCIALQGEVLNVALAEQNL